VRPAGSAALARPVSGARTQRVACADIDAALAEATAAPIGASGGRATAIGLGMREFGRLAARALLVLIEKTLPCGGGRIGRLTARARRVDIVTPTDAIFFVERLPSGASAPAFVFRRRAAMVAGDRMPYGPRPLRWLSVDQIDEDAEDEDRDPAPQQKGEDGVTASRIRHHPRKIG